MNWTVVYIACSLIGALLVGIWMRLVLLRLTQIRDALRPARELPPERELDPVADGLARIERGFK